MWVSLRDPRVHRKYDPHICKRTMQVYDLRIRVNDSCVYHKNMDLETFVFVREKYMSMIWVDNPRIYYDNMDLATFAFVSLGFCPKWTFKFIPKIVLQPAGAC